MLQEWLEHTANVLLAEDTNLIPSVLVNKDLLGMHSQAHQLALQRGKALIRDTESRLGCNHTEMLKVKVAYSQVAHSRAGWVQASDFWKLHDEIIAGL